MYTFSIQSDKTGLRSSKKLYTREFDFQVGVGKEKAFCISGVCANFICGFCKSLMEGNRHLTETTKSTDL